VRQIGRKEIGGDSMMHRKLFWGFALATGIVLVSVLIVANWRANVLPFGVQADRIEVFKSKHLMLLLNGSKTLKSYTVSLGRGSSGPKVMEGDGRTPEGTYKIDFRNKESRFHLSLHVSYPDSAATRRAQQLHVSPGGAIMIHGIRNGLGWIGKFHRLIDWTDGCIAVTNPEIEEIWAAIPDGVPISIYP